MSVTIFIVGQALGFIGFTKTRKASSGGRWGVAETTERSRNELQSNRLSRDEICDFSLLIDNLSEFSFLNGDPVRHLTSSGSNSASPLSEVHVTPSQTNGSLSCRRVIVFRLFRFTNYSFEGSFPTARLPVMSWPIFASFVGNSSEGLWGSRFRGSRSILRPRNRTELANRRFQTFRL